MKRYILLLALICFVYTPVAHGAELNAGLVQGIWYAREPHIHKAPNRIYVALRNNTEHDLSGVVRFTDNGERIGSFTVNALPGRIIEAWADWVPTYGEHTITATLTDVRVREVGVAPQSGEVEEALAEDRVFVDYDTDGDGTPNSTDTDDDNDTVSDAAEAARGTDPLVPNPIPKKEPVSKPAEAQPDAAREPSSSIVPQSTPQDTAPRTGLETYIPNQIVRDVIEDMTDTINDARTKVVTYADTRNATHATDTPTQTGSDTNATITRTYTEPKESMIHAVLQGGKAFVSGLYGVMLAVVGTILGFPAVLELLFLLILIYMIYRTARRFGRRRFDR